MVEFRTCKGVWISLLLTPQSMTKSTVFQKHFLLLHHSSPIHLLLPLLSLVCVRSLSLFDGAIQRHSDLQSEHQHHTLVNHAVHPRPDLPLARTSPVDLNRCHPLDVHSWGFTDPLLASNNTQPSSNTTNTPIFGVENPQLVPRHPTPDPTLVCNQIAGFQYARHGTFAATKPLLLQPNRQYIFSITSSTNIRSIFCWRNTYNIVARQFVHSTMATIRFQLEESTEVHFTIVWNYVGSTYFGNGLIGLVDPAPVGEVALFIVPGFAAL